MISTRGTASRKVLAAGFTAALLGAAVLSAPLAAADDIPVDGSGDVTVTVDIEATGDLYMTVDANAVALAEVDGEAGNRTFEGTLPTVTVTDTRSDIPDGDVVGWSVVGQASDFVHADDPTVTISNENFGWVPAFVDEPVENEGVAGVGSEVEPAAEGGDGLTTGADFLFFAYPSEDAQGVSNEWQANAELRLAAPADDVVAGSYSSTLTLSLFEY